MSTVMIRVPAEEVVRLRLYCVQRYGKVYGKLAKTVGKAIVEFLEKHEKNKDEESRGSKPTQDSSNH